MELVPLYRTFALICFNFHKFGILSVYTAYICCAKMYYIQDKERGVYRMVGDRVRELRKLKGMSLRKLASLADVAVSNISNIENNKVSPSAATLEKLAIALGINQRGFFEETVYNEKSNNLEKREEVHSFTVKLVEELLKANIIDDKDNIPKHIIDLVVSALKADAKERKGTKN